MFSTRDERGMRTRYLLFAFVTILVIGCQRGQQSDSPVEIGYVSTGISSIVLEEMQAAHSNECMESCDSYEFIGFANPPALNTAPVYGEIDIAAATSSVSVALARAKNNDIKYVSPNVLNSAALVVKEDSDIFGLDDLNGKRIGWYSLPTGGGIGFLMISGLVPEDAKRRFDIKETGAPLLPTLLT